MNQQWEKDIHTKSADIFKKKQKKLKFAKLNREILKNEQRQDKKWE
jgi:hypothetical protein